MIGHATMMNKQNYSRNYHIFNRFDIPRCHCGSCSGMLMFSADSSSIIMFANIFMSYSIVQPETLNCAAQHHCWGGSSSTRDHAHSTPQSRCKQSNVSTAIDSSNKQDTAKQLNNSDSRQVNYPSFFQISKSVCQRCTMALGCPLCEAAGPMAMCSATPPTSARAELRRSSRRRKTSGPARFCKICPMLNLNFSNGLFVQEAGCSS